MGNNNSTETKLAITAGVVGGAALILLTGGTATPLVMAGAEGARAYHTYTNHQGGNGGNSGTYQQAFLPRFESQHLALLGMGAGIASRSSESSSASTSTTTTCFEKRTIWDWWCNGLTTDERQILLEHGYNDRGGCFTLEELKSTSERMYAEKAPGKPTEKDGFTPDRHKGDKLVKNPNGQGKGWLDKKGEVWVPTGDDGHGGAHWDVQNPRTGGHRDVYPGGRTRYH